MLRQDCTGLYHLAGPERLSRHQMGLLLAARYPSLHPKVEAASLRHYQGPARSPDTSLVCAKVLQVLPQPPAPFSRWIEKQAPA
jgi:dTDP-4-dehydrorhamnose reductase